MSKKYETYKHPNGVECLTTLGFFQKVADDNGTTASDEMSKFFDDFDKENERARVEMKKDKAGLLKSMLVEYEYYAEDNPTEPKPIEVIEIVDVELNNTLRVSKTKAIAMVKFDNGETHRVVYSHYYSSGSFYEPPEEEGEYEIADEIKK